jgi:hypothetical protein
MLKYEFSKKTIITVLLAASLLAGCGNNSVNTNIEETSSSNFSNTEDSVDVPVITISYIGAWIDEAQKRIFILDENGIGNILTFGSDSDTSSVKKVKMVNSLTWTEDKDFIYVVSNLGSFKLTKANEGEEAVLKLAETIYRRFDTETTNELMTTYLESNKDSKQNNDENSEDIYEIKEIGSSIETDFVQITIDDLGIAYALYPDDTSNGYLFYDGTEGYHFVFLKGTINNIGRENISSRRIHCKIVLNNTYTYDAKMTIMANPSSITDFALRPFEEATYYIYADIPDAALSEPLECCFQIGFNNNFLSRGSPYDFNYMIEF